MLHRPPCGSVVTRRAGSLLVLFALLLSAAHASADVVYLYDPVGRLVRVIDETGQAATYIYDPVGNILQIARQIGIPQDQSSIGSVDPPTGAQGSQVTLPFTDITRPDSTASLRRIRSGYWGETSIFMRMCGTIRRICRIHQACGE